jgi:Zn-dependent protease
MSTPLIVFNWRGTPVHIMRKCPLYGCILAVLLTYVMWWMHNPLCVILFSFGLITFIEASVFVHEAAHVAAMKRVGWEVDSIMLTGLAGAAVPKDPFITVFGTPKHTIFVAGAGPFSNLVLTLICGAMYAGAAYSYGGHFSWTLKDWVPYLGESLTWAAGGVIFLYMATALQLSAVLVNYLPMYPLDGGLMLFALLTSRTHSRTTAARWTMYISGVVLALLLIAGIIGIVRFNLDIVVVIICVVQLGLRVLPSMYLMHSAIKVPGSYDSREQYAQFVAAFRSNRAAEATPLRIPVTSPTATPVSNSGPLLYSNTPSASQGPVIYGAPLPAPQYLPQGSAHQLVPASPYANSSVLDMPQYPTAGARAMPYPQQPLLPVTVQPMVAIPVGQSLPPGSYAYYPAATALPPQPAAYVPPPAPPVPGLTYARMPSHQQTSAPGSVGISRDSTPATAPLASNSGIQPGPVTGNAGVSVSFTNGRPRLNFGAGLSQTFRIGK